MPGGTRPSFASRTPLSGSPSAGSPAPAGHPSSRNLAVGSGAGSAPRLRPPGGVRRAVLSSPCSEPALRPPPAARGTRYPASPPGSAAGASSRRFRRRSRGRSASPPSSRGTNRSAALRPGDVFELDGGDREGAGELEIALQVLQPHDLGGERQRPELAARRQAHPVADGVGAVAEPLGDLLDFAAAQAVGRPLRGVAVGRGQHHAGAAEARDGLRTVPPVEVAERRCDLDAEHEAAAELARLGETGLQGRHLVQGGELVEDHPDAPVRRPGRASAWR